MVDTNTARCLTNWKVKYFELSKWRQLRKILLDVSDTECDEYTGKYKGILWVLVLMDELEKDSPPNTILDEYTTLKHNYDIVTGWMSKYEEVLGISPLDEHRYRKISDALRSGQKDSPPNARTKRAQEAFDRPWQETLLRVDGKGEPEKEGNECSCKPDPECPIHGNGMMRTVIKDLKCNSLIKWHPNGISIEDIPRDIGKGENNDEN